MIGNYKTHEEALRALMEAKGAVSSSLCLKTNPAKVTPEDRPFSSGQLGDLICVPREC